MAEISDQFAGLVPRRPAITRRFNQSAAPLRFVAQRGETTLPNPIPPGFLGFAGSIGINVLLAPNTPLRVGQNCFYAFDGNGQAKERFTQWDHLCQGLDGPGFHRVRISPYDPERRIWIVNDSHGKIIRESKPGPAGSRIFPNS